MSRAYVNIWKKELDNNPHLFETFILTKHETRNEAASREADLQRKLKVLKNDLYINRNIGGFRGRDMTASHKHKISKALKGKKKSPEHTAKMITTLTERNKTRVNHFTGKTHSQEAITKIKEARAKQIISEETKEKMRQSHLRRWTSKEGLELRGKMSREMSGESNPFFGKTHTPETKEKISIMKRLLK